MEADPIEFAGEVQSFCTEPTRQTRPLPVAVTVVTVWHGLRIPHRRATRALVVQLWLQLMYLNKLTEKILKKNWPLEDPMRDKGIEARWAMQASYDAARLSSAGR